MKNQWNDQDSAAFGDDHKKLRAYTSRLLGNEPDLVLHGGGNTSVKLSEQDFFGEDVAVLLVSGSGRDLATIEVDGFAPVRMDALLRLVQFEALTDADLVAQQKLAMMKADAPMPSVEVLLHAIVPFRYVDHTHADSIVAITNTPGGEQRINEVFGDRVLVIPYAMPGIELAQKVNELSKTVDWSSFEGMVLMNHGLFTFGDDARSSYDATIKLVSEAENYLEDQGANRFAQAESRNPDLVRLAKLRKSVADRREAPVICNWDDSPTALGFAQLENVADVCSRGPVTPDHSIRTKRVPLVLNGEIESAVASYADLYMKYFEANRSVESTCLEPSPRWIVAPEFGFCSFGRSSDESKIVADIAQHTAKVIQQSEALGGWTALTPEDVFAVEYWELEQAKLNQQQSELPLQGKIALVTGAANGIGKAVAEQLHRDGAAVIATDINPDICNLFDKPDLIGRICDVCDAAALKENVDYCISKFGGLDIVVSNAGVFSQGQNITDLEDASWDKALQLNLTQHKNLLQFSIPFLKHGVDPTFILIGTKNVAAPGPGASAYSVSKAGVNQLMRVAALELGADGIRVNTIHPDCVFDTGLWDGDVLETRARKYGMSVEEYKSRNVLKRSVTSDEVARLVSIAAGKTFAKTTGAQIPIDGGNERVI